MEAVACKDWLTNKVDRSVTGKVAMQQTAGEVQLPLNDCAVVALDYQGTHGIATALGHAVGVAMADPRRGSEMAITEALTNIVFAPIDGGLRSVSLSANWMWPCKNEGEDARLYAAVQAASDYAVALGINIPTGKDSLSMTQKYRDGELVYAPGTVIITSAAEVSDDTPDPDRTGSADIVAAGDVDLTPEVEPDADRTANHPQANVSGIATGTGSTKPQPSHGASHSSVTITLKELLSMNGHSGTTSTDASPASQSAAPTDDAVNDDTPDSLVQYGASSAQTTVIPLLEREERALRDARAGLDGYDSEGNPLAESSTSSK